MWIEIIIAITAVFVLLGVGGANLLFAQKTDPNPAKQAVSITYMTNRLFNKSDIKTKLHILASTPAPKTERTMGAMCYAPIRMPTVVEYICPVDGEKTIYTNSLVYYVDAVIPQMRYMLSMIHGIHIELDESEFCRKCNPDIENPKVYLTTRIDENTSTKVAIYSATDLTLLQAFLNDRLVYSTGPDGDTPLKDQLKRLEEILGVKAE